ncbi:SRSO17 transposase [Bradyrhizobium sp. SBR1B]|nr:SRSO17 transposase [Bradyrhizobium sp. SBR1B]
MGNEPRKTGWMRAEAAGDPGPWRQQAILGRGQWDADALRDIVREYALETLGDEEAVLVIDETGFLKQGKASCGFGTPVHWLGGQDHQLPDRSVRLLCVAAWPCLHRPGALPATGMDERTRPPEVSACPERCGLCDEAQDRASNDHSRDRRRGAVLVRGGGQRVWHRRDRNSAAQGRQRLCSGVASNPVFRSWGKPQPVAGTAATIAQNLPKKAWRRLSSGGGTKGPRWHDWAYLELADLEAREYNDDLAGEWTRGLLIRRNIADGSLAFFSTWCPKGTSMQKLVAVEGHRWAIEDSFETAKNELGLDHNETRSWHGWHRHVSLVMLAFAMMAVIRHRANTGPLLKKTRPRPRPKQRS